MLLLCLQISRRGGGFGLRQNVQIVKTIMDLINSHGEQRVAVGLGNFCGFSPVSLEGETPTAELPALPAIRQNDFNVNVHTGVETCLVHSSIMSGYSQISIPYWDGWQCLEVDDRSYLPRQSSVITLQFGNS